MTLDFDLIIKNATIVDGTGKPAYKGSIGIKGEHITAIGDLKGDAEKTIDATGLIAMPGFIDVHSHADWTILWYPKCESYVYQGVTTFVGGQCGGSPAPIREYVRVPYILQDYLYELAPFMYYPESLYPLEQVNEWMEKIFGWTITWRTMGEFFKVVMEKGISCNYAPLLGHGAVRYAVMGKDYKRKATREEVEEMIELIHQGMKDGCLGMSTGLDYDPDVFADEEEIVKCVTTLKEYGGVYSPHWRRTGRRRDIPLGARLPDRIEGIRQVIETCRKTGVPLQIAHLYGGYEVSPPGPSEIQEAIGIATLKEIDKAIEEGYQVTFDVIPYNPWWNPMPYLCSLLAPWLRLLGSREKLGYWLKIKDFREEIKQAIFAGKWFIRVAYNPNVNPRWAHNIKVIKHKNPQYNGKTIAQLSRELNKDPLETYFDLIAEDPDARGAVPDYRLTEDYVKLFFKHPAGMVGVDVAVFDDKYERKSPPYTIPGINTYSAYPSFLIRYVKEQKIFTLEEAVQKISTLPARVYKLRGRGTLLEGSYADIVLIDFDKLEVTGTPLEPRRYPKGIEYVIVNGKIVINKGEHTNATPGKVLTRLEYTDLRPISQ